MKDKNSKEGHSRNSTVGEGKDENESLPQKRGHRLSGLKCERNESELRIKWRKVGRNPKPDVWGQRRTE